MTTLPKFDVLQGMRIVIELEQALAGNENAIAQGIKQNIAKQTPARIIIATVSEMAEDNYNAMADMIGIRLVKQIFNFQNSLV